MFTKDVSNVLCYSENHSSRQEESKMLRVRLQLQTQMHIDPQLERPLGVWAENSQQMTQEENIYCFNYLFIMLWLFDLFQGMLCVYFQLHRTSAWEPAPASLAPGCRGHLCWFAPCWSSPFRNRWVLLGVDLIPCTWKFMLLDLKQPLLRCKKELIGEKVLPLLLLLGM